MSESTMQSATELASQYSVQVNDDLERNVKEQERVSAEITALQQQLAALQHDHALLVNMQQALGITSPAQSPAAAEPAAGAATVPAPRGGTAAGPGAGRRTRGKKAASSPKRATASKTGAGPAAKPAAKKAAGPAAKTQAKAATGASAGAPAKAPAKASTKTATKTTAKSGTKPAAKSGAKSGAKPAAKSGAKSGAKPAAKSAAKKAPARPTLVELVREHLAGQREPRSAAEVATALGEAHTGRTVKTTVVRTTLEGLVARNQAQRTKQGTSVYYTATEAPAPAPAPAPAQQKETAAEAPSAPSGT
ncbi:hypothetical protein ADL07_12225 [Streptomyces sp. NRRL F-4707]|uniref:hypothetical protein n=1 Tax=Streptomyces sp. NRRL F-4707 TaxID=1519496 RepID=UPI0006AD8B69|nr:hypothetical protein [Streptomyces sp. NRRL F-4707]KOX32279.1 hypothetical protein ADL07_12225 [Streptomyces sp. NRRL F-4707]